MIYANEMNMNPVENALKRQTHLAKADRLKSVENGIREMKIW